MKIQAVANSYWRSIQREVRTFEAIADVKAKAGYPSMQEQVRYLAKQDVVKGEITAEDYQKFIGEEYVAE